MKLPVHCHNCWQDSTVDPTQVTVHFQTMELLAPDDTVVAQAPMPVMWSFECPLCQQKSACTDQTICMFMLASGARQCHDDHSEILARMQGGDEDSIPFGEAVRELTEEEITEATKAMMDASVDDFYGALQRGQ